MGSGPLARSVLAGLVGLSLAGLPAAAFAQSGKEASSAGKRWEEEFSLWQKVSSGSDVAQYEGYLKQYPNGTFASMARLRIAELQAAAKAKPVPSADDTKAAEAEKAKADEQAAAEKAKAEAEAKKAEEAAARKLADEKAAAEEKARAEAARLKAEAEAKKAEEAAAARKLAEEKAAAEEKARTEAAAAEKARADEAARVKAQAVKAEAEKAARKKAEEAAAAEKARAEQEATARREAEAKRVEAEKAAAAEKARIEREAAAARKLAEEKEAEVARLKAEAAKAAAEAEAKAAEAARLTREAEKRANEAAARTTDKADTAKREEEAFQKAVVAGTQQAFRGYLDAYPEGRFAGDARERLSALAETAKQKAEPKRESETAKLDNARREPVVDQREAYLGRAGRAQAQRWLSLLGFNTYGADGLFGPRTRLAIAAWQEASGYRPDGYLKRPQYRALRQAADYAAARQRRYQRDYDVLEGPVDGYYDGPYYRDDGDYRGGGGMVIIPGY